MDWLGIGVFIIGITLFVLVIILISPLLKLAKLLESVRQSTDTLPKIVDKNAKEAHTALINVNELLVNVNQKMTAIHPIFEMIQDAGLASKRISAKWLHKADVELLTDASNPAGLNRFVSFIFYLAQNKDALQETSKELKK